MKNQLLKLSLLLFGGILITSSFANGQQILNSGFESWENVGTNTEEPLNWNSNKTGTGNATIPPKTISREATIVHSGTYSAKIKTESYIGTPVNGVITTGRVNAPTFSPSNGYNDTRTDNGAFNAPLNFYPDSIVFWAYYTAGNGTDLGRVSAVLHDNYNQRDPFSNDPNGSNNVVATAIQNFTTTGGWVRKSVPFDYATYAANNNTPNYILVNFTSSNVPGVGSSNSILYIDDLELIYNPNVNAIAPSLTQNIYENESGNVLTVTETPNAEASLGTITREWKYSMTSGSGYVSFATAETGTTYTPLFATAGTYYVICESNFGGDLVISNEVQINVTEEIISIYFSNIDPADTQNLLENESGTELEVTEGPTAADSREWKYSTTSGSGYISFATAETGTTYTPLFATANTYYIVCESNFGGTIETSNEVQINVTEEIISIYFSNIDPADTQDLLENESGTELEVTEGPTTADSREWKYSTTSGSGYISFATPETGTTYTPLFANAGTYYIVCESNFGGTIETSNEVQINVTAPVSNSVSIAPTDVQNLEENEAGTQLSVTELPSSADLREWKYSTTSGSGYVAFATSETGSTYTPLFATAGTYYVVCESDFGGEMIISNEVIINVSEPEINSIDEFITNGISFYQNDNKLLIDIKNHANTAELKIHNLDGRLIKESSLNSNAMNAVTIYFPAGIYIVSVSLNNQILQTKIFVD